MHLRIDQEEHWVTTLNPKQEVVWKPDAWLGWIVGLGLETVMVVGNSSGQSLHWILNSTHQGVSAHHLGCLPFQMGQRALHEMVSQACAKEMANLALQKPSKEIPAHAKGTLAIAKTENT